jgi:hypothetical protein
VRFGLLASVAVLLGSACRDSPPHVSAETPAATECHDYSAGHQYCVAPRLRLVIPFARGSTPTLLVAGGEDQVTELTWEDRVLATRGVMPVGQTTFNGTDRFLPCDVDADGEDDIVFSPIDALSSSAVIWGDATAHDAQVQRIAVVDRLQGARCLDIDADGHADLFGILDGMHFGVLSGDADGFSQAASMINASITDEHVGFSSLGVSELDDTIVVGRIRYQESHLDVWRVDVAARTAELEGVRDLSGYLVQMIDASHISGADQADLVITADRPDGGGALLLLPGDADGPLASDLIVLERPERPLRTHDVDADGDGDTELLVVGQAHDGVYLVDLDDGALHVVDAIAPVPTLDATLLDFDNNGVLDLALIRADLDQLELVFDAIAPAPQRSPRG